MFSPFHLGDARCILLLCFRLVGFLDPEGARKASNQSLFEKIFILLQLAFLLLPYSKRMYDNFYHP